MIKKNNTRFFSYRSFLPEFKAMKEFSRAGVNTVCIFPANTDNSLGTLYSQYPPVWRWFGKYDFASLDKQFDDVLAINKDAAFICMIDLNTPIWLQRQMTTQGDSSECESFSMLSCACANPKWVNNTMEYLEAFIGHMEKRYPEQIEAYLLACGQTDEWMDYSRGSAGRHKTKAWEQWLAKKGKAVIPVPSFDRLDTASFENFIRDPEKEQDIIDYVQFTGDVIVDAILTFSKKARELIPAHRQIGMFFGYVLELTFQRMVFGGHLEYERLYESEYIDFFISPGTYGARPIGEGSGFMVPNGTRVRYNKGFLHEMDHRTPTYNCSLDKFVSIGCVVPWKDQADVNAGLKREFSLAIINQISLWCFDMWGGVFKTPETMKLIEQSKKIWDKYSSIPQQSKAEIALIVDPQSARYINDNNTLVGKINHDTRNKLNQVGAPFEVFSFNDIPYVNLDSYKLIVFPGLFTITPEKMAVLKKYVLNRNRTVLFVYAPGICDGKDLDTSRIEKLTGSPFNSPELRVVPQSGWTAAYLSKYENMNSAMLKKLAFEAGVHIYCKEEIPVYASNRLLMVHTANGGKLKIKLPQSYAKIKELYSNQIVAQNTAEFNCEFKSPDTLIFELSPDN